MVNSVQNQNCKLGKKFGISIFGPLCSEVSTLPGPAVAAEVVLGDEPVNRISDNVNHGRHAHSMRCEIKNVVMF